MKMIMFEGSPEEFKAVEHLFSNKSPDDVEIVYRQLGEEQNKKITHKEAYRIMLTRRSIKKGQMDLYKTVADKKLEFFDYLSRMGRTSEQIRGVHGALGRRIGGTKEIKQSGLPGNMTAVVDWTTKDQKDYINLKPEFIEVLREEGII